MFLLKKVKTVLILSWTAAFLSCSLNYGTEQSSEETVPEFSFKNAVFNRYENGSTALSLEADKLEQYKSDGSSYAQNAKFKTYSKTGELDTEGFCQLLASNTKNKEYSLFNGISINIYSQDLKLQAQSLHFDGKTEQLTSAKDEAVTIERKNTIIEGKGFSASAVSKTYSFISQVSGTITDNSSDTETETTADQTEQTDQNEESF